VRFNFYADDTQVPLVIRRPSLHRWTTYVWSATSSNVLADRCPRVAKPRLKMNANKTYTFSSKQATHFHRDSRRTIKTQQSEWTQLYIGTFSSDLPFTLVVSRGPDLTSVGVRQLRHSLIVSSLGSGVVKPAFHDADTDTDILARIVARMSACRSVCHRKKIFRKSRVSDVRMLGCWASPSRCRRRGMQALACGMGGYGHGSQAACHTRVSSRERKNVL